MSAAERPVLGLRGRSVIAVVGVVLLVLGGWLLVTEPVDGLSDVLLLGSLGSLGLAGVLFPLADPREHDAWWRVCAVLAAAPVVATFVVLGPLGVLAPDVVASPDAGTRWPRTPDRAVVTGWWFLGLAAVSAGCVLSARRNRRRVERERRATADRRERPGGR